MPAMIVLGDKTDHGGEVIEASGVTDTHGKRIARVGDKVTCPKKGHGTNVIVTGDLTMVIDGKAVAYHGCKTACGAMLISGQSVTTVDFGGGGAAASASAARATASAPLQASGASPAARSQVATAEGSPAPATAATTELLGLRFQAISPDGSPLAGRPYTVTRAGGAQQRGVTDGQGLTEPIEVTDPEQVAVHFMFVGADGATIDRKDLLP
jgi:uncharacterized Zn-binding protein involved in type VI secretion